MGELYAKRDLSGRALGQLFGPGATLGDPVISGAAFFRATAQYRERASSCMNVGVKGRARVCLVSTAHTSRSGGKVFLCLYRSCFLPGPVRERVICTVHGRSADFPGVAQDGNPAAHDNGALLTKHKNIWHILPRSGAFHITMSPYPFCGGSKNSFLLLQALGLL